METHLALFSDIAQSPLYRYLRSLDYCMVGWCGLTLLAANPELQDTLRHRPL